RRVRWFLVVQRGTCSHLHGRRRVVGHRYCAGAAGVDDRHPDPPDPDLRDQRHRGRLRGDPDGCLQGIGSQAPPLPHVADPPPLRVARLAGDDRHHPLLVDRGGVRGGVLGDLHRRLHAVGGRRTMTTTALIYGMAISGEAVARALVARGVRVLVADDSPDEAQAAAARAVGAELIASPDDEALDALVAASDLVCPAPGVPETHRVIAAALRHHTPIRTEIDLAYQWEQERAGGPRPMLAVTGTDGKTTTTMMAAAMLRCTGLKAAAVGNTETPLIAALDTDVDAFVVECSSFRLNWIDYFRSEASVWLNLAPDHQNWHVSMEAYEQSKARMWHHHRDTDVSGGCGHG